MPFLISLGFTICIFMGLIFLFWGTLVCGHYYGRKYYAQSQSKTIYIAENVVFTLLGLLIAFTFTNSFQRYELRKALIVQEANAIETVSQLSNAFPPDAQVRIRKKLVHLIDTVLALHERLSYFGSSHGEFKAYQQARQAVWKEVLSVYLKENKYLAGTVVFPPVLEMFNAMSNRIFTSSIHAHFSIFVLLISLAMLSFFFIGYKDHETKLKKLSRSIFICCTLVVVASVISVNIDLEFPRIGLIRLNAADDILIQEKNDLINAIPSHANLSRKYFVNDV